MITFEFISTYNGRADYRVYIDGRSNTRITANQEDRTLSYGDGSPVIAKEVHAFNAMLGKLFDEARAVYPQTGPAPIYRPALELVA